MSTFNFNIEIPEVSGPNKKDLDVYFQPALTWADEAKAEDKAKGVALLFLENKKNASSAAEQDFREMLKILLKWVWQAFGKTKDEAPTTAELTRLFDAFAAGPLTFTQLDTFLGKHFNFRVREFTGTKLEATVFPMFPHLHLKIGATDKQGFASDNNKLDAAKITQLKNLNEQFKSRFAPPETSPDTIEAGYLPEFIFTGYFRMLIRSGLQELINMPPASTLDLMLGEQNFPNDRYQNIAGMASTFLLNGYRVPAAVFGSAKGLYEATGQQFRFEDARMEVQLMKTVVDENGDEKEVPDRKDIFYQVSLHNPGNTIKYLKTPDKKDFSEIKYRIDTKPATSRTYPLYDLSQKFKTVKNGDFPAGKPGKIELYTEQNMNFALRQAIDWKKSPDDPDQLLPLSSSLRSHIRGAATLPLVTLHQWPAGDYKQEEKIPNDGFSWVTMIKFNVRRIPGTGNSEFLAHTYEITEASDDDLNLLEDIFNFLAKNKETNPVDLYLAYASAQEDTTDLSSLEPAKDAPDIQIFRSNLASNTAAAVESRFSATRNLDPKNKTLDTQFLQLIWEGCTVATGGYYLYVQHQNDAVDEAWFKGTTTAAVHLIIDFTNTADPIHPFNNAVLLKEPVKTETDLVLARSSAKTPVQVIPAGHTGFKLTRFITRPPKTIDGKLEAKNLYHMLGFGLGAHEHFKQAEAGMPIGPVLSKENPSKWLYERLIPAFAFWASPPASEPGLPPRAEDPYLGVQEQVKLPAQCWWQDVYGNKLNVVKNKGNIPIGYTDPIIGLNQWPSVNEHFRFIEAPTDPSAIQLILDFSFDTSPYTQPGETTGRRANRLEADLLSYRNIYYQIIQNDITLTVETSIDSAWKIEMTTAAEKDWLLRFVKQIYAYLSNKKKGLAATEPGQFSIPFNRPKSQLTLPDNFIFEVEVRFTISRNAQFIHENLRVKNGNSVTLEVKDAHREVLTNTAFLTPNVVAGAASVRAFAETFELAFPDLRLALSEDRLKKKKAADIGRPYFAVQLGTARGISYNILEENPAYFALPPLANTLLADAVPVDKYADWKKPAKDIQSAYHPHFLTKQFEAIDPNVLARKFLVAVEDFLEPENLVAAMQLNQADTEAVLHAKSGLAEAISNSLDVILDEDRGTGNLQEAKEALKRALLTHLVKGYDIETAVQFQVAVSVGRTALTSDWAKPKPDEPATTPRIRGTAVVKNIWLGEDPEDLTLANPDNLDFSLSAGRIDLQKNSGNTTYTYLFDTKTPEKFAAIYLELEFRVTEIEHTIEEVPGIPEFQASNWLRLVHPEGLNTYTITDALILDAEKQANDASKTLLDFQQALHVLKSSNREKTAEHPDKAGLEATLKKLLVQPNHSKYVEEILGFAKPVFAVTQAGISRLTPVLTTAIQDWSEFQSALATVRASSVPGTAFSTLPELEAALKKALTATKFNRFRERLLKFTNPVFKIEGALMQELEQLIEAGQTELAPLRDALNASSIKTLEFLSLHGLENGLRKGLPPALFTSSFKDQVISLANPVYRLETAALDRLDLEATNALTLHRLLEVSLQEIQGAALFERDYFLARDFEAGLKQELGRLIYEKYKTRIQKYARPFFQVTNARLDLLELRYRGNTAEASLRQATQALRSGKLAGRKFFTHADFEAAVKDLIRQDVYDQFSADIRDFCNPYRISDSLLDGLLQETGVPEPDRFKLVVQELAASKLKNVDFVAVSDFDAAVIGTLGNRFFSLFKNQLDTINRPFYRMEGAMLTGLTEKHATEAAKNSRVKQVLQTLKTSALKNAQLPSLEALDRKLVETFGEADTRLLRKLSALFTNPNYMGKSPIPIPLRHYPTPPSLIHQGAEVDESSRTDLEDIRQWEYTIIYEHEDIAQDSIDCIIYLNTLPSTMEGSLKSPAARPVRNLLQALINFNEIYPLIAADLAKLRDPKLSEKPEDEAAARQALLAFKTLASEIENAWKIWTPIVVTNRPETGDMHFEISEEPFGVTTGPNGETLQRKQGFIYPRGTMVRSKLGADDPEPRLALPGYQQEGEPVWDTDPVKKTYTFIEDLFDQTFFGDSDIPDRKFSIENLDVIEHQNAWAAIWLSRNKILLAGHKTNPKFIFQTPAVRFTNLVSPFITNDEPWDLATLHSPGNQADDKPLLEHLQRMVNLVAPDVTGLGVDYEVRLSCRYAFALAEGKGLNTDLQSTLPLLLGLRLNPSETLKPSNERLLKAYPKMLTDEIKLWLRLNDPSQQNATLLFSIDLFSKVDPDSNTSLPMLRIKRLELKLKNILDLKT